MTEPAGEPRRHPRAVGGSDRGRHRYPRRVSDMVRALVRGGFYSTDDQLIEDTLMASLGASRSAVRGALRALADEGLVARSPRHGTVVRHRPVRLELRDTIAVHEADSALRIEITDQRTVPTTELLRERLGIVDDTLRMVENTFHDDVEPIGVRTAYFPHSVTFTEYAGPVDMTSVAQQLFGTHLGRTESEVGSALCDDHTGRLLGIPAGSPVLVREQLVFDASDRPLELVFDHYRADRVTFVDVPHRRDAPDRPLD